MTLVERRAFSKVPEVTLYFWMIKVLSTGMGETTSDFFIHRVGVTNKVAIIGIALVTGLALALSLVVQFGARRYVPWIYWLVVVLIGVFGTMAADGVHVGLSIPYVVSSAAFAVALSAIFAMWFAKEKTLSIHSIYTRRREAFYWAVVLTTFALGTAVGDMTAFTLHLGFFASGVIFAAAIALPALGYSLFGLNEVLAFWIAYILTRPLGASFADWLAGPRKLGGLGLGFGAVSVVLAILIVGFVAFLTVSRPNVRDAAGTS
jgi:uncharacterized membrane-anchored protein